MSNDPHADLPVLSDDPTPARAAAALILLHGRGASAEEMLRLHEEFQLPTLASLAPQAAGHTWYPQSFLAPLGANEPYLSSALAKVETIVSELMTKGISSDRIALLGFSQGACLTSEFVARHPRRYGAVLVLTGGLIGPEGTPRNYQGSLNGTPVFIGANDPDPHVPFKRVLETRSVLESIGAQVEVRRYPGEPHSINRDEMITCRTMLQALVGKLE